MKLLVSLNNKKVDDYLNYTNSFILGLKDFSINYLEFDLNEIKELLNNYKDIELFISLNGNYFNKDLKDLEKNIIELSKLPIKGIMFYDLAVLEIVKRNNLNVNLCWHQEHMVNNYNTCNYYLDKGCNYAYLTSDITTDEIMEISEKSKINLISFFYGHPMISFSKRSLITNYFLFNKKKKEKDVYTITSKDSDGYLILENNHGTEILTEKVLNGIMPFSKLKDKLSYGVLDEQFTDHDTFIKILSVFCDLLNNKINSDEANDKVYDLCGSKDTMFFDIKTIYKVKNNEKKN